MREETVGLWEVGRVRPLPRHHGRIFGYLGYDPEPVGAGLPASLRAARRRGGLTQAELATRMGLDVGTMVDFEAGRLRPNRRVADAVAAFLAEAGFSVDTPSA